MLRLASLLSVLGAAPGALDQEASVPRVTVDAADPAIEHTVEAYLLASGFEASAEDGVVAVEVRQDGDAWTVVAQGAGGVRLEHTVPDGDVVSTRESLGHVATSLVSAVRDAELQAQREAEQSPPDEAAPETRVESREPPRPTISDPPPATRRITPADMSIDRTARTPITAPVGVTAGYQGGLLAPRFGWQNGLALRLVGTPRHSYVGAGYDVMAFADSEGFSLRRRPIVLTGGWRLARDRWDLRIGADVSLDVATAERTRALPGPRARAVSVRRTLLLPSLGPAVDFGLVAVGPMRVRGRVALQVPTRNVPGLGAYPVMLTTGLSIELGNNRPRPPSSRALAKK